MKFIDKNSILEDKLVDTDKPMFINGESIDIKAPALVLRVHGKHVVSSAEVVIPEGEAKEKYIPIVELDTPEKEETTAIFLSSDCCAVIFLPVDKDEGVDVEAVIGTKTGTDVALMTAFMQFLFDADMFQTIYAEYEKAFDKYMRASKETIPDERM